VNKLKTNKSEISEYVTDKQVILWKIMNSEL